MHHDIATHRALAQERLQLPGGLEIAWLGTAGFLLQYEGDALLLDPYVSRAGLGDLVRRRVLRSDLDICRRLIDPGVRVVGIAVGHTHFDHALDTPTLVAQHRCPAFGSTSLRHLLGLHGLHDHSVVVEPGRPVVAGPFTLTFNRSVHSRLIAGMRVPAAGELSCEHVDHLTSGSYRCGQVYGIHVEVDGTTIYHQGSADFVDDELRTGPVDVFLAGIAGRAFTKDYFPRIMRRLDPEYVLPCHYDNFLRPLGAELSLLPNIRLTDWVEATQRLHREATVLTLPRFDETWV